MTCACICSIYKVSVLCIRENLEIRRIMIHDHLSLAEHGHFRPFTMQLYFLAESVAGVKVGVIWEIIMECFLLDNQDHPNLPRDENSYLIICQCSFSFMCSAPY